MNENENPILDGTDEASFEMPEKEIAASPEAAVNNDDSVNEFAQDETVQQEASFDEEAPVEADAVENEYSQIELSEADDASVEELSDENGAADDTQADAVTNTTGDDSEFNPYAPKNDSGFNTGVNPGYNQPFNAQQSNFGGGYPSSYGYNNQQHYSTPPKSGNGGKKAVVAVIALCVIVAAIALVSSFFGNSEGNTPSTSTTAPHSAIPTETTSPTTIPSVATTAPQTESTTKSQNNTQLQSTTATTVSSTQAVTQQINSIWVAEKVRPSVVGVLAYQQGELAGEGSGVLMSEDDAKTCTYIVTCAHVINEPGCEFAILLLDGSSYEATVVAIDERTDIGVLKVEKTGLPLAEFGDSASLKVGEPIYAIGNPGGSEYFGSITNGIVASIDRSISATYTMTCIQHNAAINPGNSGGALVNTAGQVIGINSSKIAKTDFEGMGFAVPSAIFASVVDSLIRYGYVPNRPELGIKYASVSDYQLYSIIVSIKGLPKGSIIIADIPEGSALENSGAQVGDLIIAVNGKKMDTSDVLLDLIDTGAVGDTLTLTLCRIKDRSYETSTFDVTVKLVENKGSITTTTQAATLPEQDTYGDFEDFFGGFFGW